MAEKKSSPVAVVLLLVLVAAIGVVAYMKFFPKGGCAALGADLEAEVTRVVPAADLEVALREARGFHNDQCDGVYHLFPDLSKEYYLALAMQAAGERISSSNPQASTALHEAALKWYTQAKAAAPVPPIEGFGGLDPERSNPGARDGG